MRMLLLASAAIAVSGSAAFAQEVPAPVAAAPPAAAAAPVTVDDAELKKFVAAANDARKVMTEHQAKVTAAADEAAKAKAQADMTAALTQTVSAQGFTVQRYNEIATAAQVDKALADRIVQAASSTAPAASPAG